jgi:antitoxin MazE
MMVQFTKWGNSIAVRIPAAFLKDIGATEGKYADLSLRDGALVITPLEGPVYDLDGLLSGMTREHSHGETDTGKPVDNEVW